MAESVTEPGAGNIEIELDGKVLVLTPSLEACVAVSSIAGGLNAAIQRCLQLDFDTICKVITAGLGLNPTQAKMVPKAVYATGTIDLAGACVDFIHIIGNGGRPLAAEEEEEGKAEGDPPIPASP